MKTPEHNHETAWGAISGFLIGLWHNLGQFVDFKSVGTTIVCTITGIIVGRLVKKYFPEKKSR